MSVSNIILFYLSQEIVILILTIIVVYFVSNIAGSKHSALIHLSSKRRQ